ARGAPRGVRRRPHKHLLPLRREPAGPRRGDPGVQRLTGSRRCYAPPAQGRNIAMSKVVAIMSMSLDGYVADLNDGVAEVFDWYFTSGNVDFHTGGADPMTFKVSGPSADDLRGPISVLGAMLTGRRTCDRAVGLGGA